MCLWVWGGWVVFFVLFFSPCVQTPPSSPWRGVLAGVESFPWSLHHRSSHPPPPPFPPLFFLCHPLRLPFSCRRTLGRSAKKHTHTLSRRGSAVFWHLYHEPALAARYPVQTCGSYHRSKLVQSSSHVQITFNMSDKTHHGSFLKPTADQWLEEHTLYNVIIHWGYLRPLSSEANCSKLECLFFCFFVFYQWTAF